MVKGGRRLERDDFQTSRLFLDGLPPRRVSFGLSKKARGCSVLHLCIGCPELNPIGSIA